MNNELIELKGKARGVIIGNIVTFCLIFVIVLIFDINPDKEYGWFLGCLHGVWAPANLILSWINDAILMKAPLHTNAYIVWWWIGCMFGLWSWHKMIQQIIAGIQILSTKN